MTQQPAEEKMENTGMDEAGRQDMSPSSGADQTRETVIDEWDAPVPDGRELVRARLVHYEPGGYSAQIWDDEDEEWIEDGDANPIWLRRLNVLKCAAQLRKTKAEQKAAQASPAHATRSVQPATASPQTGNLSEQDGEGGNG